MIPCKLVQTGCNSFSIRIASTSAKRVRCNEIACVTVSPKRRRLNDDITDNVAIDRNIERPNVKEARKTAVKNANQGIKSKAVVRANSKPKPCEHVDEGDIVLCKMRGFSAWPAMIRKVEQNSVFVEFFGDHTTQKTMLKNLYLFHESHSEIISNLKRLKNPMYSKAIREAERALQIPDELSIFTKTM